MIIRPGRNLGTDIQHELIYWNSDIFRRFFYYQYGSNHTSNSDMEINPLGSIHTLNGCSISVCATMSSQTNYFRLFCLVAVVDVCFDVVVFDVDVVV